MTEYPYALTKNLGEQLMVHWSKVFKLSTIALRLFNVYGLRSRTTGAYGAMFGVFLAQKINNKPLTIVGNGKQTRDFTYVEDIVEVLSMLKNKKFKKNQIYNICSNRPIHIKKLVNYLIKKTHNKKIKNVKHNSYEAFKTHGQNNKILKTVSFKKFSDFYTTVDATLKWYKEYNHLI